MAKKPKKQAVMPDEPKAPAPAAKSPAPAPAPQAKGTTPQAKGTTKSGAKPVAVVPPPPPPPPPPVEKVKKVKRPRFVREKKEPRPRADAPDLAPRSTKVTAKLMTKGLVVPPKDDAPAGQKPR